MSDLKTLIGKKLIKICKNDLVLMERVAEGYNNICTDVSYGTLEKNFSDMRDKLQKSYKQTMFLLFLSLVGSIAFWMGVSLNGWLLVALWFISFIPIIVGIINATNAILRDEEEEDSFLGIPLDDLNRLMLQCDMVDNMDEFLKVLQYGYWVDNLTREEENNNGE